jgi:hypothetical protein
MWRPTEEEADRVSTTAERFVQTNSSSGSAFRHSVKLTVRMMGTHGEDAALAWFHEHERLSAHIEAKCPMAVLTPEPDLEGAL